MTLISGWSSVILDALRVLITRIVPTRIMIVAVQSIAEPKAIFVALALIAGNKIDTNTLKGILV